MPGEQKRPREGASASVHVRSCGHQSLHPCEPHRTRFTVMPNIPEASALCALLWRYARKSSATEAERKEERQVPQGEAGRQAGQESRPLTILWFFSVKSR